MFNTTAWCENTDSWTMLSLVGMVLHINMMYISLSSLVTDIEKQKPTLLPCMFYLFSEILCDKR